MEFTANQIASLANGTVEGDGEVKISTIAKIEEGHPERFRSLPIRNIPITSTTRLHQQSS